MPVKIDKNVPIPERKKGKGPESRWPWRDLNIGDSFLMPDGQYARAAAHAHTTGKRLGVRFVTRKVEGGVRIWRTA